MADVTDSAFRSIIAKYGKPDIFWTEFVSADGLVLADKNGQERLKKNLRFSQKERPIIAQLFTSNPANMAKAVKLVKKLGFDGVDINMGCPDRSVEKQGAGAALIKNPALAREVLRAAKKAAGSMPVSVKTRLGYNKDELEVWLPQLLIEEPAAVTIHARTRKEMSDVPARWERVKRAVEIRNELKSRTLILGNGDVKDLADAREKIKETGADGVMLGRAIFGNPWLFSDLTPNPSPHGRGASFLPREGRLGGVALKLKVLAEHTSLFEKHYKDIKSFAVMKKHFKAYVSGFDGAHDLRAKLMETENSKQVKTIINDYLTKN